MFLLKNNVRKEIKFKVFIKDIGKFYSWLLNSPFKKSYEDRRVNSLYYDTYNLDFANDNITGLSKRIKIRARWYSKYDQNFLNDFCKDKNFKFEVKRKVNNLSDKALLSEVSCNKEDTFFFALICYEHNLENSQTPDSYPPSLAVSRHAVLLLKH